jgi:hypothetical protein
VLIVPFGMAVVGVGIGDGRAALGNPAGQLAVLVAFAMMAGCWLWAEGAAVAARGTPPTTRSITLMIE